jgi:hypothetical protein
LRCGSFCTSLARGGGGVVRDFAQDDAAGEGKAVKDEASAFRILVQPLSPDAVPSRSLAFAGIVFMFARGRPTNPARGYLLAKVRLSLGGIRCQMACIGLLFSGVVLMCCSVRLGGDEHHARPMGA